MLFAIFVGALGHGDMVDPVPRNANPLIRYYHDTQAPGCFGSACFWYQQGCCCGRNQCDNIAGSRDSCLNDASDNYPANCPGMAPVVDPCGYYDPQINVSLLPVGQPHGSKLAERSPVQWIAGSEQLVRSAVWIQHGGVYQYRLCPKNSSLTEACFQRHVLPFAHQEDPKAWKSVGTKPSDFNDTVLVPKTTGKYVLQWRWDSAAAAQIWANCADVEIVTTPSPPPLPPSPISSTCKKAGFELVNDTSCDMVHPGSQSKIVVWSEEDCCNQCINHKDFHCIAWNFLIEDLAMWLGWPAYRPSCILLSSNVSRAPAPGNTCGIRKSMSFV